MEVEGKENEMGEESKANYVNVNASTTFFGFLFLRTSKKGRFRVIPSHFTIAEKTCCCLFGTTIKHA